MKLDNREVEITDIDNDGKWSTVLAAVFIDDESELTEDQCAVLEAQYQDRLREDHFSSLIDHAEYAMEG
jgi:hypothetical protein